MPPDTPPAKRAHHHVGVGELARLVLLRALVQRVDGEIRRDGIESARVHDAGAGVDGLLVVQVDAFADEHRLTRQIGVVGSRGGARGNQRQPVLDVRPDGRHHHLRLGRQRIQRRRLRSIRGDQRPRLRALPQRVPDCEQLVLRPAGQRDAGIAARSCQIFGGQLADEAGRSVQDDVELTLRCAHGGDATRASRAVRRPHPARDGPGRQSRPGTRSWRAAE